MALIPVALALVAGFALYVFVVVAFLLDLGLVVEAVDLAETAAAATRRDAVVFEDIAIRVGR